MAVRKDSRGNYVVDFRFEGFRHRKAAPGRTKAEAEAYETLLRGRLLRGEKSIPDLIEVPRFTEYAASWLAGYVRANNKPSVRQTKEGILRNHLVPTFGRRRLDAIKPRNIERYKAQKLRQGFSPKTLNNHLGVLHKLLACAVDDEIIERVPRTKFIKTQPAEIRYLSSRECELLLSDSEAPLWNRMAMVGLYTGMRIGELFALHWVLKTTPSGTRKLIDFKGLAGWVYPDEWWIWG